MKRIRHNLLESSPLIVLSACLVTLLLINPTFGNDGQAARAEGARVSSNAGFSRRYSLGRRERRAGIILARQRDEFLARFAAQPDLPFTRPFGEWRDELPQEPLYRSLQRMPKGGLLHIHSTATGDAAWIVDQALSMPDCFIYWGAQSDEFAEGQLGFFPNSTSPPGWVRVAELKVSDPGLRNKLMVRSGSNRRV